MEETTVNHHKFDAKRQAQDEPELSGYAQISGSVRGSAAAPAHGAENDRHARFDALVTAHLPVLSRVAYRLCEHRETAEELVQETLLRAWRHLDQLRDDKAAKSWLFMILRRERARSYRRQPPAATDIELERLTDGTVNPGIDRMALYEAIESLPAKYRVPLVLFSIGGFDVNEIATDLCLKAATVKTRLFRARSQLRDQLRDIATPESVATGN